MVNTYLTSSLISLDAEETVASVRRAEYVAERSGVSHVLRYEGYLVHRVVVQRILMEKQTLRDSSSIC